MDLFPSISIIIPSYNQGRFIERTILSILKQDYPGKVEVIVSDGKSIDQTVGILKKYQSRLTWWSEKDNGFVDAVNKGIAKATGDIIAIQNSDDFYLRNAFRYAAEGFQRFPNASFVVGGHIIIGLYNKIHSWDCYDGPVLPRSIIYGHVPQNSTFVKSEFIRAVGGLRNEVDVCADGDLWYRISALRAGVYIAHCLSVYQLHPKQRSVSVIPWFDSYKRMVESCETRVDNPIRPFLDERERKTVYTFWELEFTGRVNPLAAKEAAIRYYEQFESFDSRTRNIILRCAQYQQTSLSYFRKLMKSIINNLKSTYDLLDLTGSKIKNMTSTGLVLNEMSAMQIPELDIDWWKRD